MGNFGAIRGNASYPDRGGVLVLSPMHIRQMRYFISVAELLSFTKAAERHCMAQTSMSQQIQEVERQLGELLLQRDHRSVSLTPAGLTFLAEARRMVNLYEESVRKTHEAAAGSAGSLRIGFLGPNERLFLPRLIRNFRRTWPTIDLGLVQGPPQELLVALREGSLDCAFTLPPPAAAGDAWESLVVHKSPIKVAMSRGHPLAGKKKVSLEELEAEPFVSIDDAAYPGTRQRQLELCARHGFVPRIVSEQKTMESLLLMVEAEIGIGLLPLFLEAYTSPAVCFVDIADETEAIESLLLWPAAPENPALPLLLDCLRAAL